MLNSGEFGFNPDSRRPVKIIVPNQSTDILAQVLVSESGFYEHATASGKEPLKRLIKSTIRVSPHPQVVVDTEGLHNKHTYPLVCLVWCGVKLPNQQI